MTKTIGSISHGTLRSEDLLPCFLDELKAHATEAKNAKHLELVSELTAELEAIELLSGVEGFDPSSYWDSEHVSFYINEDLIDALNSYAMPYFYFGTHPGDGSDFGFWLGELDEFDGLRVSDLSEIPDDYQGEALLVNDHGNTSLYACDNGKQTEVWAVV